MDLSRIFKSETDYSRFIHFLDHDPLDNQIDFVDSSPGKNNVIVRSELQSNNRFVIPALPYVQFKADYRLMTKTGHQQATTVSDCTKCHVMSVSKRINQSTRDIRAGAQVNIGFMSLDYTHLDRQFREHADAPTAFYPPLSPSFPFFPVYGVQTYDQVPDSETRTDQISTQFRLPYRSSLFTSYVNGRNENRDEDRDRDFSNFYARFNSLFSKYLNLRFKYRDYSMDNDMDKFLPKSLSGITPDPPRSMTRDIRMFGFEGISRFKRWITFRAGYEKEHSDRDHLGDGNFSLTTDKQTFKSSLILRPHRNININFRYKMEDTDDPFTSFLEAGPFAEMTSLPTDSQDWYTDITWTPRNNLSFLASYRLENLDNNHLSWHDKRKTYIFSAWMSVSERLSITGTYSRQDRHTGSPVLFGSPNLGGTTGFTIDPRSPYDEKNNSYLVNLRYQYNPSLSFNADFEYTDSKADADITFESSNVGQFSDLDIQQIRTSFGFDYVVRKDISVYGRYTFRRYEDQEVGRLDGNAHIVNVGLTWHFALL